MNIRKYLEEGKRYIDKGIRCRQVRSLREKVNPDIIHWWAQAWAFHVEGFHEARLNIEEVKARVEFIEKLVELSKS